MKCLQKCKFFERTFSQKSNSEVLSERSGELKTELDLMRYSYEKKCPVLFVSITVSGVI